MNLIKINGMLWENLLLNLCPKCGKKLILAGNKTGFHCVRETNTEHCKFFITPRKRQKVEESLKEKSFLNNLK